MGAGHVFARRELPGLPSLLKETDIISFMRNRLLRHPNVKINSRAWPKRASHSRTYTGRDVERARQASRGLGPSTFRFVDEHTRLVDIPRVRGFEAPYGILQFYSQQGSGGGEGKEAHCDIEKEAIAALKTTSQGGEGYMERAVGPRLKESSESHLFFLCVLSLPSSEIPIHWALIIRSNHTHLRT